MWYYFYMKTNVLQDFHICISVPLNNFLYKLLISTRQGDNIRFSNNTQKSKTSLRNICLNFLSKKKKIMRKLCRSRYLFSVALVLKSNEVNSEIPFKVKNRIICRGVFRAQSSSNLGAFFPKKVNGF